jgi:hypothetical protein
MLPALPSVPSGSLMAAKTVLAPPAAAAVGVVEAVAAAVAATAASAWRGIQHRVPSWRERWGYSARVLGQRWQRSAHMKVVIVTVVVVEAEEEAPHLSPAQDQLRKQSLRQPPPAVLAAALLAPVP